MTSIETQLRLESEDRIIYHSEPYSKANEVEQWVRLSDGCPNNCPFCYAPTVKQWFGLPEIQRNDVKIMDMNFLSHKEAVQCLKDMAVLRTNGKVISWDFVCGFDYRFLTSEIAELIKAARVPRVRIAWDWYYRDQIKIKPAIDQFVKAGYRPVEIMVFMLANWKITYTECCLKLDMLKIWGVMVADCYFDNQTFPGVVPIHWTDRELKDFRHKCRVHNRSIRYGLDPDVIPGNTN